MPSSTKENMPATTLAMDNGDVFGSSAPSDMMLSPPPEEELRYTRRPTNEPSSASRPLASSMRTNQQSPLVSQASKRKRTITSSGTLDPAIVLQNQQESANTDQHTPNPRVRKQVRHAVVSPNPSQDPASLGSPLGDGSRPRMHPQDDAPMTPTRKGKSRGRSTELVPESPYAENPNADYIPPSRLAVSPRGVNVRRRSVTPIPPYEPPKERYTPPREIIVSPPAAAERKPSRRSTGKKKGVTVKTEKPPVQLRIKTEPPEVDLTTPAPPASPSEDPILLVGPPIIRVQRPSASPNKSHEVVNLVDFELNLDLLENRTSAGPGPNQNIQSTPPRSDSSIAPAFDFSRVDDDDDVGLTNNGWSDTSSDADFGTVVDNGVFANVNDDGWSDSDDENGNGEEGTSVGEGDFTGKFVAFEAPVKLDPPADEGDRMEAWARPISPHPKRLSLIQPKDEDEEASIEAATDCETEIATDEEPEHDSEDGASDVSVVKIMSDDPMAAARAAAILKMHDYDMVARKLRRRRTTVSGVSKAYSAPKNTQLWRRRTVAGLGAEDALTDNVALPELLVKAEEELRNSPARSRSGSLALSSVGSPQKSRWNDFMYKDADPYGVREWTKADWKLLDSCFTDERYDLGEQQGLGAGCLADVEDVPLESVIERFIELKGGVEKVESHGPSWTMEKLMGRVTALCKRQRSGNGAPPTPDVSARFSTPSRFSTLSPSSSMIVPDFTPRGAGRSWLFDSGSVNRKATLPPPSSDSFFKVPSMLPARHSRLRDEVDTTGLETPKPKNALDLFGFATPSRNLREDDSDDESVVQEVDAMLTPINTSRMRQARPESAVKRSLSYITSWLKPDVYKSKSDERKGSQLPGLPVPPEDVLSKPRGPVETPAPKAAPKAVPHKELVSLEHIPPPPASKLPRRSRPRRLVDLNHVPTPHSKDEGKRTMPRRSSTSSVKDLVKEFEQREKRKEPVLPPRVAELRRQASVGSLKAKGKPTWKP